MAERLSDSNNDFIDSPSSSNPNSLPNDSAKIGSRIAGACTEWIPYHNQSSMSSELNKQHAAANVTSLAEGMFWDISNIALAQGRLQRKILLNNKQEVWRYANFVDFCCPYFSFKGYVCDVGKRSYMDVFSECSC